MGDSDLRIRTAVLCGGWGLLCVLSSCPAGQIGHPRARRSQVRGRGEARTQATTASRGSTCRAPRCAMGATTTTTAPPTTASISQPTLMIAERAGGRACDRTGRCVGGACSADVATCDDGFADLTQTGRTDAKRRSIAREHCGGCRATCSPAYGTGVCEAGSCAVASCSAGYADCDSDYENGCETVLRSLTDCGASALRAISGSIHVRNRLPARSIPAKGGLRTATRMTRTLRDVAAVAPRLWRLCRAL